MLPSPLYKIPPPLRSLPRQLYCNEKSLCFHLSKNRKQRLFRVLIFLKTSITKQRCNLQGKSLKILKISSIPPPAIRSKIAHIHPVRRNIQFLFKQITHLLRHPLAGLRPGGSKQLYLHIDDGSVLFSFKIQVAAVLPAGHNPVFSLSQTL